MKKSLMVSILTALCLYANTSLQIHKGWNLVGSDIKIENIKNLMEKVTAIFAYDTEKKSWKISYKGKTTKYPTVDSIDKGEGFWVLSQEDDEQTITVVGSNADEEEPRYKTGWQILSPKKDRIKPRTDLNSSDITIVWNYLNNHWRAWSPHQNIMEKIKSAKIDLISEISKGEGFWLLASKDSSSNQYDYIPKDLTDAQIIRFLNKTTFGATPFLIQEIKTKGIKQWIEDQFSIQPKDRPYLTQAIIIGKKFEPKLNTNLLEEYLAENDIVFNKYYASFHSPRYTLSSWFKNILESKDQLRHKVTYALSQIIVESDFEPIFTRRAEALASYFDILYKNAFGSYKQLLTDISFNPGMAMFLTFNGSTKAYQNKSGSWVFPDENYAREIMQLFSIGLNKLNLDGTPKTDEKGNLIPTYTQEDVNELARVFTGWDLKQSSSEYWGDNKKDIFGLSDFKSGDYTHSIEFTQKYHDFGEKKLLGDKISANLNGEEEIKTAIDIIMSNPNVAPYISKNLIMRLTKSNPSAKYIQRVATVFKDTNSNLKEVVKAIFLDPEFWDDIKNYKIEKFKEPLVAYTGFLRAFNVKPFPKWVFCGFSAPKDKNASNCSWVENEYLFNDTREYLGQGPGLAPTVFNFYDNDFQPNNKSFKDANLVAPEVQIQSDSMLIKFHNKLQSDITKWEINRLLMDKVIKVKEDNKTFFKRVSYNSIEDYVAEKVGKASPSSNPPISYVGVDKMLLDMSDVYQAFELALDGNTNEKFNNLLDCCDNNQTHILKTKEAILAVINLVDKKLLGGVLKDEQKQTLMLNLMDMEVFNHYRDGKFPLNKKMAVFQNVILPVVKIITTSDEYMTE